MLESGDKAVVLSALTFLGGRHLTEPSRHFAPEPQESKYADVFQRLMENPRIRELIGDLTKSVNAWVRQAAVLAAREPRERQLWSCRNPFPPLPEPSDARCQRRG